MPQLARFESSEAGADHGHAGVYASPEQARGHVVDERADVYAIGALLTHVLTGRPPYEGKTTAEIVAAVQAMATAPGIGARTPVRRSSFVAIIESALMARDPAASVYRTAREALADDLAVGSRHRP